MSKKTPDICYVDNATYQHIKNLSQDFCESKLTPAKGFTYYSYPLCDTVVADQALQACQQDPEYLPLDEKSYYCFSVNGSRVHAVSKENGTFSLLFFDEKAKAKLEESLHIQISCIPDDELPLFPD